MHRNPLEHQTGLPVGRFSFFLYRGALVAWSNVSIHLLAAGTYCLVLNWLGNLSDSELKIAIGGLFLGFLMQIPTPEAAPPAKKTSFTGYTYVAVSAPAKIKPLILVKVHPVVK